MSWALTMASMLPGLHQNRFLCVLSSLCPFLVMSAGIVGCPAAFCTRQYNCFRQTCFHKRLRGSETLSDNHVHSYVQEAELEQLFGQQTLAT